MEYLREIIGDRLRGRGWEREIQGNRETRGDRERTGETLLTRDLFGEETWRHKVRMLRVTGTRSCRDSGSQRLRALRAQ